MAWYWIVLITLVVYWMIGAIIAEVKYGWLEYWAVGLLFPVLYVVLYPVRAILTYNRSHAYYERHGITRLQYFFGKRVHNKD